MIRLTRLGKELPEDEQQLVLNIDHIISVVKHQGLTCVSVSGMQPDEFPWHVSETVSDVFEAIRHARRMRHVG